MKKGIMIFGFIIHLFSARAQKSEYDKYPVYNENDLGLTYTKNNRVFRIWVPSAERAQVICYMRGDDNENL
jgi:pullulanase